MTRYVALLRGINVGGKNLIRMPALKATFEANGFENVSTYVQSGNVLFDASDTPALQLTKRIEKMLARAFEYVPTVVVRSRKQMRTIVDRAPKRFGSQPAKYRYDVFFLREPLTARAAMKHVQTNPAVDTAKRWPRRHLLLQAHRQGHGQPGEQVRCLPDLSERVEPQLEHDEEVARADGVGTGHSDLSRPVDRAERIGEL
jgi:uncharacterized protein (DUF1697 family)